MCHHTERSRRRLPSPPVHASSGYTGLSVGRVPEQFGTSLAVLHLIRGRAATYTGWYWPHPVQLQVSLINKGQRYVTEEQI